MSWDVHVIGGALDATPEELAHALRDRGIAVEWRPRAVAQPELLNGNFAAAGEPKTPRLARIHVEDPEFVDDAIEARAWSPDRAQKLRDATHEYWLAISSEDDERWQRAVAELVAEIAERTDGVVLDVADDRYYDASEWRARHLGGGDAS